MKLEPHPNEATDETEFIAQPALIKRWKTSGVTLWRLRKKGKLTGYKLDGRGIRYALSQVLQFEQQSAV